eukprot:TRINITY_DN5_c0_g1_i1.p1 TRINITY_DN5_c0_g1~~TRINITY_DN5_c0_g1_i1.p1  ORF type:complete len:158 (-),score=16.57 TRINITY_DN5_c0_g1_i1:764-1237(-)
MSRLGDELAHTTDGLDLLLSTEREETSTDDDGDLGEETLAEDLEEASLGDIDDGGLVLLLSVGSASLLRDEGPQLVDVEGRAEVVVAEQMEVSHTNLTEVTRMVFVEVDAVMVLTTSVTATTGMLAVLSDTTVTGGDVSSFLAGLLKVGSLVIEDRN